MKRKFELSNHFDRLSIIKKFKNNNLDYEKEINNLSQEYYSREEVKELLNFLENKIKNNINISKDCVYIN